MRISGWLLATGLISGGAFAADQYGTDQNQVQRHTHKAGKDVRTGYEQTQQDVNQTASDAKQGATDVGEKAATTAQQAGQTVSQGVREGTAEVAGQKSHLAMGELRSGKDVHNTVTTDAVGIVTGQGLNAEYAHPLGNKFAWNVGGQYGRVTIGGTSVNNVVARGGADYFIVGRHNEGLRIGPRLEVGLGTANTAGLSNVVGQFAADGEIGYNWISSGGITAQLAGGVRERLGGNPLHDIVPGTSSTVNEFGPYARVNLGYSW